MVNLYINYVTLKAASTVIRVQLVIPASATDKHIALFAKDRDLFEVVAANVGTSGVVEG